MIVGYDRSSGLTTDQKLESLTNSVQLALNEIMTQCAEINKSIEEIKAFVDGDQLLMRGDE